MAAAIVESASRSGIGILDKDIVVVTHKVVSKAEGQIRAIPDEETYRKLVEDEAVRIVRRRGDLVITQTKHGFICAKRRS